MLRYPVKGKMIYFQGAKLRRNYEIWYFAHIPRLPWQPYQGIIPDHWSVLSQPNTITGYLLISYICSF